MGLILAVIVEVTTGNSVAAKSSGLLAFDIFEVVKEQLGASFQTVGLSMLPIYGYAAYMNKIGASPALGRTVAKPVQESRNPYFVGVAIAIIICGIMRIAIVSAFAIIWQCGFGFTRGCPTTMIRRRILCKISRRSAVPLRKSKAG